MSSEPFAECEFCPVKCKLHTDAASVFQKDPNFLSLLLEIIGEGNQDKLVDVSYGKSREYFRNSKSKDVFGLSYCLIAKSLHDLELPKDLKQKIARTAQLKLGQMETELGKGVAAPFTAIPKASGASSTPESTEIAPPIAAPVEEPAGGSAAFLIPKGTTGAVLNPQYMLLDWIRSDKKFNEDVKEIAAADRDGFKITFDPNSEGYLRDIVGTVDLLQDGKDYCLSIECNAAVDVTYEYNIVFGRGKKGWVAASIQSPKLDEFTAMEEIQKVNRKEQVNWDRLMITFNNDKELLKAVGSLALECPVPGAKENLKLPVWLIRQGKFTIILLRTFISKNLTPSDVFTSVMETIAGDMDYLRDISAGERSRNVTTSPEFYRVKGPAVPTSFNFKYLPKDEQVSLKICPSCRKPLPDPKAEYRRCPHCLFKLM